MHKSISFAGAWYQKNPIRVLLLDGNVINRTHPGALHWSTTTPKENKVNNTILGDKSGLRPCHRTTLAIAKAFT
jgi:hypothetical protein